jgi:hypothetical protein
MGALTVGTSSVVPRPTGQRPAAAPCVLSLTECDARRHAPFSPRDRRLVRQHDVRSVPWPAPGRPNRLAAPRSTRRAMRRTDFCHLTSSYEHPRLVGSWPRKLPLVCPGIRLLHGRAIHFGGAPALAGARASDTPVALLARGRGRRPERSRESMRFGTTTRSVFRRAKDLRPATLSRAPGSGLPGDAALPPRRRLSMPLDPREPFWVRVGRAPVHASRCHREARFSGPVTSLADFCNRIRRVGTPDERPILARERGFRSAAHRQVMPAALACPMRLHASDGPRATTRAGHGSERPSEGKRAAFCERFRAPFLVELPAPGSSIRASCGTWSLPQTRRTDRDPRAMPLREKRCRTEDQGAFRRDGTLTRTEDCSSGRA